MAAREAASRGLGRGPSAAGPANDGIEGGPQRGLVAFHCEMAMENAQPFESTP